MTRATLGIILLIVSLAPLAALPGDLPGLDLSLPTPTWRRPLGLPVAFFPFRPDRAANRRSWLTTSPPAVFESREPNPALFRAINSARSPWLDVLMSVVIYLGKAWILIPAALLLWRFRPRLLLPTLYAQAIAGLVSRLLKDYHLQPRPGALIPDVFLMEPVYNHSFPSADTALAFALAWSLHGLGPRWLTWTLHVYAFLIAWERIYVGAHFPLDVLVGAFLGTAAALAIRIALARRYPAPAPAPQSPIPNP